MELCYHLILSTRESKNWIYYYRIILSQNHIHKHSFALGASYPVAMPKEYAIFAKDFISQEGSLASLL